MWDVMGIQADYLKYSNSIRMNYWERKMFNSCELLGARDFQFIWKSIRYRHGSLLSMVYGEFTRLLR